MKLVVGLGNPGRKYVQTRHNVGFDIVAEVGRKFGVEPAKSRFQGETMEVVVNNNKAILLCPHTYMNLSGQSVREAYDFYKLDPEDILICCDDLNLPLGRLRFRAKGTAGGQKGLADIIKKLNTTEVPRLRFGIDPTPPRWNTADYVLSKFKEEDREEVGVSVAEAADGVADWITQDISFCMNRYNAA